METQTLALTDFLLTRIAEDRERLMFEHHVDCGGVPVGRGPCDCGTPDRLLAEVRAKRRIMDIVQSWQHVTVEDCWYSCAATYGTDVEDASCNDAHEGQPCDCGRDMRAHDVLAPLAAVYADHPDYRDDWRP